MEINYFEDLDLKNENYSKVELSKGDYDNCFFTDCNFSNSDLSDVNFAECLFVDCDFSNAKLNNSSFKDVSFTNCKLMGLHFDYCNKFLLEFSFKECILNFSSFYKLDIKNTTFQNCKLEEVEFVEANLSNSIFQDCDLSQAIFENTILEKADLSTSYNFTIDPETNQIKKAKFSRQNIIGLLDKYNITIE